MGGVCGGGGLSFGLRVLPKGVFAKCLGAGAFFVDFCGNGGEAGHGMRGGGT